MELSKLIAVLWSPSQKAFHKEPLCEYVARNELEATGQSNPTDYKVIFIAYTDLFANVYIDKMTPILRP